MTYQNILYEMNALCAKHPKCYVSSARNEPIDCPYGDLCFEDYPGPNNGIIALETAILKRYLELKTGKPVEKFYFTFGSDPSFPFQNAYIIILANSETEALEKFREEFPNRHENTLNCSFWYSEETWKTTDNEQTYGEPAKVIA